MISRNRHSAHLISITLAKLPHLFIGDERLDDELVVLAQRAVVRLQVQLLELLVLPHPALRAEVGHGDRTQRLDELFGLERRQVARRVTERAVQRKKVGGRFGFAWQWKIRRAREKQTVRPESRATQMGKNQTAELCFQAMLMKIS